MFQEPKTSLKQDINFVLAIVAAGFKLTDSKTVDTDDGQCWHATLTHGRTKIVTVSNGGYGGPDELDYHATSDAEKAAHTASLNMLFAVPEVLTAIQNHLLYNLELDREHSGLSEDDYEVRKADILATAPAVTNDNIEFLVGQFADVTQTVNVFKRAIKTKLLVAFEGDDETGGYTEYKKMSDTPENRAKVKAQAKREIAYFIADLFNTAN